MIKKIEIKNLDNGKLLSTSRYTNIATGKGIFLIDDEDNVISIVEHSKDNEKTTSVHNITEFKTMEDCLQYIKDLSLKFDEGG